MTKPITHTQVPVYTNQKDFNNRERTREDFSRVTEQGRKILDDFNRFFAKVSPSLSI